MTVKQNALVELRAQTTVDCDTMDLEVVKAFGPFEDCTSNQAIALNELLKPQHQKLIASSIELATVQASEFSGTSVEELAVEIAMIKLQLLIAPHISGNIHIQTNPKYTYSTEDTVTAAKRVIGLTKIISPDFPSTRICIKIPSTWEGIQACRILQESGIKTLATTLFSIEQAILAAEAQCTYVAPYVNELKVHFDATYKDPTPLFSLCSKIQRYYELHAYKTQVLAASLTSTAEIMTLAGIQHITISPPLLALMSSTEFIDESLSVFGLPYTTEDLYAEKVSYIDDEERYRAAFEKCGDGSAVRKLLQAVEIFSDCQVKLEALFKPVVDVAEGISVV